MGLAKTRLRDKGKLRGHMNNTYTNLFLRAATLGITDGLSASACTDAGICTLVGKVEEPARVLCRETSGIEVVDVGTGTGRRRGEADGEGPGEGDGTLEPREGGGGGGLLPPTLKSEEEDEVRRCCTS